MREAAITTEEILWFTILKLVELGGVGVRLVCSRLNSQYI